MCGIAGVICFGDYRVEPAFLKGLLTANADRGKDATGIAYEEDGRITVRKAPIQVKPFIESLETMGKWASIAASPIVLLHTRSTTVGAAAQNENNHPVVHGQWAVIHNGIISNDDEVFEHFGTSRFAAVDTAALVLALAREGTGGLRLLQGFASFAAWSSTNQQTVVLGKLPNAPACAFRYYPGKMVVFSSELPITQLPEYPISPSIMDSIDPGPLSPIMGHELGVHISLPPGSWLRINTREEFLQEPIPIGQEIPLKTPTFDSPGSPWAPSTWAGFDLFSISPREKVQLDQLPPMDASSLWTHEYYRASLAARIAELKTIFGRWVLTGDRYQFHPTKSVRKWVHRHQLPKWWEKEPITEPRPLLRARTPNGTIEHVCSWCGVVEPFDTWRRTKGKIGGEYHWECPSCHLPVSTPSLPITPQVWTYPQ